MHYEFVVEMMYDHRLMKTLVKHNSSTRYVYCFRPQYAAVIVPREFCSRCAMTNLRRIHVRPSLSLIRWHALTASDECRIRPLISSHCRHLLWILEKFWQ